MNKKLAWEVKYEPIEFRTSAKIFHVKVTPDGEITVYIKGTQDIFTIEGLERFIEALNDTIAELEQDRALAKAAPERIKEAKKKTTS